MFSLGYREKAVPNIDIWHAHLKSSLEEPSHPALHKFININVLWPIAEILHVSFSVPYIICSVAVDLRVSNVVAAPNYVVAALLPEAILGYVRDTCKNRSQAGPSNKVDLLGQQTCSASCV